MVIMDLYSELHYDADPITVFSMLTDEAFIARKTTAAKALRHEISVSRDGDRVTIELLRVMAPDVPDFLRRFVGDTIDIKQTDAWGAAANDGSRSGEITLTMAGAPVTCTGKMTLANKNSQTVVTISGVVKASIPLLGSKIEKAVHEGLVETAKIEEQVGRAWLSGRR